MKRSEIFLMVLQMPLDWLMLLLSGFSAYGLRFSPLVLEIRPVIFGISLQEFMQLVALVAIGWLIIFAVAGLYSINPNRKFSHDIGRVILGCATGLAAVAVYVMFRNHQFDSRFLVAASAGFAVVYVTIGRLLVRGLKGLLYRSGVGLRRMVVIGTDNIAKTIIETLRSRKELGYVVVASFPDFREAIISKLRRLQPDEVLFTNPRAHETEALQVVNFCNQHHVVFKYSADLFSTIVTNMSIHPLAGVPIVELKKTPLDGWGRVLKRLFDIIISIIMLISLSPLIIGVAIDIFFETGWPIIYKNERVGIRGKRFFMLKFRSMYQKDSTGIQFGKQGQVALDQEEQLIKKQSVRAGPIYKIGNDPRVTPLGRFIRRFSIDELPQLLNVIKGEMSLVGPRPHQPREVKSYVQEHSQVFTLKPGITGLAQISGRSDLSFEEEMTLDVLYIEKWSLLLDCVIFLKTPFILFKKRLAA